MYYKHGYKYDACVEHDRPPWWRRTSLSLKTPIPLPVYNTNIPTSYKFINYYSSWLAIQIVFACITESYIHLLIYNLMSRDIKIRGYRHLGFLHLCETFRSSLVVPWITRVRTVNAGDASLDILVLFVFYSQCLTSLTFVLALLCGLCETTIMLGITYLTLALSCHILSYKNVFSRILSISISL